MLHAVALILVAVCAILICAPTFAAAPQVPQDILDKTPPEFRNQFLPRIQPQNYVPKAPGHYSRQDWAGAIDSTWGDGLPYWNKIALFNIFWNAIDDDFAAFQGLDANIWDSIWIADSVEIYDTVSRGRFNAMILHSCMALRESHTKAWDDTVSLSMPLPGVPLMYVGVWGWSGHFGAALTPLPDSSLLVYRAIASHPLGLVPGDLVLGYDGIPWKDLYRELLDAQLPIGMNWWWGSSGSAFTHSCLMACGENWHLFDTIDIVKYDSGDTLHLPTSLLVDQNMNMWVEATEQMDIPGVPMPDYTNWITWGVIDGTSIGYIYSLGWHGDSAQVISGWINAIDSLKNHYFTTGLIIDVRTNYGASYSYLPPLELLFGDTIQVFGGDIRCAGGGHFDMCPIGQWWLDRYCIVNGNPSMYYDKPIAVLTGPGALSGGDLLPVIMAYRPMTKLFGKPTTGARNGASTKYLQNADWKFAYAAVNTYLLSNPGEYLTRKEFPSLTEFPWADYEPVWLTQDGVAQGRDDVVEAAVAWLEGLDIDQDGVVNENDNCPDIYNPEQIDTDSNGIGDACQYTCGDASGDAAVNIGDAVYLITYIFKGGPAPEPLCVGDASGDVVVNIGDAVYLINYIFKGGPPPVEPCCL